ncbi:glucose-6-phosphate isomerase [Aureicoccus marinus]|uniref:Glucose-6-phosphate isomerase n=1 Tax=Aureicoccus marinus TaxID=754435 RepID=A0A2S7TA87_9FLAO|nr:glucose-6-phosphate isomerase [Aureicoccus marinus]PQJ16376.1 glucose-6-phosphate isomerase [Aureicoccus marinus]
MSFPSHNPTETKAWAALEAHYQEIKHKHLTELFQNDPNRASELKKEFPGFLFDYSKNRMTKKTVELLVQLAKETGLDQAKQAYFGGEKINETEGRAVLHTALRSPANAAVELDGKNVVPEVQEVKAKMKSFCDAVLSGNKKGSSGKAFTDVVNIGIGGSDLGPVMITEALAYYQKGLRLHFVSNVDGDHLQESLKGLDPETTLFVVVSKSFTTQETLANAQSARKWFVEKLSTEAVGDHFIAVSTNIPQVEAFGIEAQNIFPMWDWVGGRFSLWSTVGLSVALAIGFDGFEELLAGAAAMDQHFKESPSEENIPVLMGLIGIWYNNFFGAESVGVIPYTQYLHRLPAYLQQAIMESNGKSTDRNGNPVDYQTGEIVWGEPGTNSQHAFFQLIHQGTKLIPCDFIGYKKSLYGEKEHHDKLMANFFAQTEALMNGRSLEEVQEELKNQGQGAHLAPFKVFAGNKPTTTLLFDQLNPHSLGMLVALYEHRIFVQGVIWNIFSYDQWGVELGKILAKTILSDIQSDSLTSHDSSTTQLLQRYKN